MLSKIFVGTSGYNYKHWGNDVFYPRELSQTRWLGHYATTFRSVELNVSFYRLPKKQAFEDWFIKTPKDFVFAAKGNRFITHMKKLKECEEPLNSFFENASGLREKLGVVLWQLPPNLHLNKERLQSFCALLVENKIARKSRHAFEFRHESWFCEEVYVLLKKFNFSLCIAHSMRWPHQDIVTADYVYLRFHGGEILYGSNYSDGELEGWASKTRAWSSGGKDIYAYFNNDAYGYAISNALKFRELLEC